MWRSWVCLAVCSGFTRHELGNSGRDHKPHIRYVNFNAPAMQVVIQAEIACRRSRSRRTTQRTRERTAQTVLVTCIVPIDVSIMRCTHFPHTSVALFSHTPFVSIWLECVLHIITMRGYCAGLEFFQDVELNRCCKSVNFDTALQEETCVLSVGNIIAVRVELWAQALECQRYTCEPCNPGARAVIGFNTPGAVRMFGWKCHQANTYSHRDERGMVGSTVPSSCTCFLHVPDREEASRRAARLRGNLCVM